MSHSSLQTSSKVAWQCLRYIMSKLSAALYSHTHRAAGVAGTNHWAALPRTCNKQWSLFSSCTAEMKSRGSIELSCIWVPAHHVSAESARMHTVRISCVHFYLSFKEPQFSVFFYMIQFIKSLPWTCLMFRLNCLNCHVLAPPPAVSQSYWNLNEFGALLMIQFFFFLNLMRHFWNEGFFSRFAFKKLV